MDLSASFTQTYGAKVWAALNDSHRSFTAFREIDWLGPREYRMKIYEKKYPEYAPLSILIENAYGSI